MYWHPESRIWVVFKEAVRWGWFLGSGRGFGQLWRRSTIWEVALSTARSREFGDSHCSNKPQYPTISKSLLAAFFSECILHVCVFCFIHIQMKTTKIINFFSIPFFQRNNLIRTIFKIYFFLFTVPSQLQLIGFQACFLKSCK